MIELCGTTTETAAGRKSRRPGDSGLQTPPGPGATGECAVMAMDDRLRYVFWNSAAERMTGIPAGAALGRSFYDVFPEGPGSAAEDAYMAVLRTRRARAIRTRFHAECYEISVRPLRKGLLVTATDVTKWTCRAREGTAGPAVKNSEQHADD